MDSLKKNKKKNNLVLKCLCPTMIFNGSLCPIILYYGLKIPSHPQSPSKGPLIMKIYESSCMSAGHNIWPPSNICGPPNLVHVQMWSHRTGRFSKAQGEESKVVHGQALEPVPHTWPIEYTSENLRAVLALHHSTSV